MAAQLDADNHYGTFTDHAPGPSTPSTADPSRTEDEVKDNDLSDSCETRSWKPDRHVGCLPSWQWAALTLCLFGFLKEVRPSESFLTEYLIGPHKNLTLREVNSEVYPVWTYSYLAFLVPVFLLTDFTRYKPVIILEGVAYVCTWALLLWAQGVLAMQFMQMAYGVATATEIGYYSYIYSVVDRSHYQKVTSLIRGAALTGRFTAAALGQAMISSHLMDYFDLNCTSMACVSAALLISLFLPHSRRLATDEPSTALVSSVTITSDPHPVPLTSPAAPSRATISSMSSSSCLYATASEGPYGSSMNSDRLTSDLSFYSLPPEDIMNQSNSLPQDLDTHSSEIIHPDDPKIQPSQMDDPSLKFSSCPLNPNDISLTPQESRTDPQGSSPGCCGKCTLWHDFIACFSDRQLLKWSVWWAVASCGNFQVGNYIQNLWEHIAPSQGDPHAAIYNGAVEAASTLSGAAIAFLLILPKVNWNIFGELLMGCVSLLDGALLVVMATTSHIWVAYSLYVIFRASYQMVITIATCQIARCLSCMRRCGLVFGCNTFVALLLQTLITVIVVDKSVLGVPITTQFLVNGSYFLLMGLIFISLAIYNVSRLGFRLCWALRHDTEQVQYEEFL